METIVPGIVLVGIVVMLISIMVFINNRDRKKDSSKKTD